jgi:hypothetical protein
VEAHRNLVEEDRGIVRDLGRSPDRTDPGEGHRRSGVGQAIRSHRAAVGGSPDSDIAVSKSAV